MLSCVTTVHIVELLVSRKVYLNLLLSRPAWHIELDCEKHTSHNHIAVCLAWVYNFLPHSPSLSVSLFLSVCNRVDAQGYLLELDTKGMIHWEVFFMCKPLEKNWYWARVSFVLTLFSIIPVGLVQVNFPRGLCPKVSIPSS